MSWAWRRSGRKEIGSYAHWFDTMERDFLPDGLCLTDAQQNISLRIGTTSQSARLVSAAMYGNGAAVPLPKHVVGGPLSEHQWHPDQVIHNLPDVPDDTVITGILDTGISLAHMRTRFAADKTRFIAAWQQGATAARDGCTQLLQPWLPSGREIYASDIETALGRHSNAAGTVDEEAFNRTLMLSEPLHALGSRELESAAAHGSHVLDLAAGHDPFTAEDGIPERHRIIAVNLPTQFAHGSAGNFLPYFATYGLERLLFLADALWLRNKGAPVKGAPFGYPVVVNFSYGMRAGPKDGKHIFEWALKKILLDRHKRLSDTGAFPSPVRVIMPAGNDNLARGAASSVLGKEGEIEPVTQYPARTRIELPWRILPDDATPNFVEVWTQPRSEEDFRTLLDRDRGLRISVTPPGHETLRLDGIDEDSTFQDLADDDGTVIARVYVNHLRYGAPEKPVSAMSDDQAKSDAYEAYAAPDDAADVFYRLALLICVPPTVQSAAPVEVEGVLREQPVAPAGAWEIRVDHGGDPVDLTFYVQSDQSAVRGSKMGKKSYFDHPEYREFLIENPNDPTQETGELADTYSYDLMTKTTEDNDHWEKFGPVQRRGSHNALSSIYLWDMTAVGSFDDSNGFPAIYSSTTDNNPQREKKDPVNEKNQGRDALTVVYPGENAPSLFGLLGAGTRDGSVVSYRGTSMSTALAARDAALAFLSSDPQDADTSKIGREKWFRRRSVRVEAEQRAAFQDQPDGKTKMWPVEAGDLKELKVGRGRIRDPREHEANYVPRLGPFD